MTWEQSQRSYTFGNTRLSAMGNTNHEFMFKIADTHRSALSSQIGEAILIGRRRGEGAILNARGEYNGCIEDFKETHEIKTNKFVNN